VFVKYLKYRILHISTAKIKKKHIYNKQLRDFFSIYIKNINFVTAQLLKNTLRSNQKFQYQQQKKE